MTPASPVSVVVTSIGPPEQLRRCLAGLSSQMVRETIVVVGSTQDPTDWIAVEFPHVSVLHLQGRSVPELRWAGVRATHGPIIAATESWMRPASNWCAMLADAHARWPDAPAIGGHVVLESHARRLSAGFYLCEYVAFAAPSMADAVHALSSANLSYKRDRLLAARDILDAGQWETVLHERWRREGHPLRMVAAAVVFRNPLTGSAAMALRYRHGREYAAERFPQSARARRMFFATGSLLLPIVLTWRVVRDAVRHGYTAALCRSFGWVVLLNVSWTAGEWAGYVRGPDAPRSRAGVPPITG